MKLDELIENGKEPLKYGERVNIAVDKKIADMEKRKSEEERKKYEASLKEKEKDIHDGLLRVDVHEGAMFSLLKKQIDYKIETLPIGDYVFGDVCIERKSMPDFVSSVRSGHLQKQLIQMGDNFKYNYLLLIGSYHELGVSPYINNWTTNHHYGMIARINASYSPKIVQVENNSQAALIIPKLIRKSLDGKVPSIVDTELMKSKMTTNDIKLKMICALPNIGIDRGRKLKNVIDVKVVRKDGTELTADILHGISGFGEKLSNTILNLNNEKEQSNEND